MFNMVMMYSVWFWLYVFPIIDGFQSFGPQYANHRYFGMHFEEALLGNTALQQGALSGERYIATNRFKVRKDAGPKFEKRWAERKSRLAQLDGFRFFTLLRRVEAHGAKYDDDFGNYVSFTIWKNKDNFDAWRTGDAFKEAHGAGGITDFIQLLSTALFILNGGPKPAFYDALLPINGEKLELESEGGWRNVVADGINYLDPEIFVAQQRYSVAQSKEVAFESVWETRKSSLQGTPGLVGFFIQRRDATKADDGFNYMDTSIWKSKEHFDEWFKSFMIPETAKYNEQTGTKKQKMAELLSGPPKTAFYEGKLALSCSEGI